MAQVCTQLSPPDANNMQTCLQWQEFSPLLPELQAQEIYQVWIIFLVGMISAWCFKKLIRMFGV